ncbi:MAG: type II secretion system F family protein [Candidatus Gracilibacteria bacterium]|nr:type II secretion system F family protein [Candidatus Gracilibacteria bacterium]
MLFRKKHFIQPDGTFDSTLFQQLLNDARYAIKTGKKPGHFVRKEPQSISIGGIAPKEIWGFINKLSSFLSSGIDLKSAFSIVYKQVKNPKLRMIVNEIRLNLDHGLSISDTLKQYKKYFDPLIISLVEVGEKTGALPKVLAELEVSLLDSIELKSKIRGAMIYPIILVSLALIMVVFMLTFILPKITESFTKTGVAIPGLTQFMMDLSQFILHHYIFLGLVIAGFFAVLWAMRRFYFGQIILSYISLRIPVFGYIKRQENTILFINSLKLLLDSGVLMLEALETTANIVPNIQFKKDIIRIKNEVEAGIKLSNAMGLAIGNNKETVFTNSFFPEDLVHMVSVGEETGTIGKNIEKVGVNYTKELKRFIANLMSALEPFIIVFVGALVGTIIIAIMLPFFQLAKVAKNL